MSGDTVTLGNDYTYVDTDTGVSESGIAVGKSITIDGNGYTLDASSKVAIFNIAPNTHVILQNITFKNGHSDYGGAVRLNENSSVEIKNCNFINNTATNYGGAVFIAETGTETSSSIVNSMFDNNVAKTGGAIYVNGSSINITLSEFKNDVADQYGGSMYVNGAVNIVQTTFTNERAYGGGAIELTNKNGKNLQ